MSDSMTIVLVVLFMLLSPLLSVAACILVDRHLVKAHFEALIEAMDMGQDFPYETDFDLPCPECGSPWQGERHGHWIMEHRQDCLLVEAQLEQSRRFDLMAAVDAEILAKDAAEDEAEYEALIWAENEALEGSFAEDEAL